MAKETIENEKTSRIDATVQELEARETSTDDSSSSLTSDLLLPCAVILLPSVALAAVLLYCVLGRQVHPPVSHHSALHVDFNETSPDHYYVNFPTSRLSTIVGKFATVAGFATSSALLLLSWPMSKRILANSCHGRHEQLPTPLQLTLLIGVFNNGGLGAVFKYLKYHFLFGGQRARIPTFLPTMVTILACFVGLQYLMMAFETWFSSTMTTISYVHVEPTDPSYHGSLGLSEFCVSALNAPELALVHKEGQCTVNPDTYSEIITLDTPSTIINASIAYAVLYNSSKDYITRQTDDGFMLPLPADVPTDIDFLASSMAIKTQCRALTSACQATVDGEFDCHNAGYPFAGNLSDDKSSSAGAIFKHSPLTLSFTEPAYIGPGGANCTTFNCLNQTNTAVKGHFAFLASIDFDYTGWGKDFLDSGGESPSAQAIPGPFGDNDAPWTYYIIGCDYHAYKVDYSLMGGNGGALEIHGSSPLNYSTFYTLNAPLQQRLGDMFLRTQLVTITAKPSTAYSVANIADAFSTVFATAFLGLSAGALDTRPVIFQQERSDTLVAKVPKTLFWVNIALPLTFAGLGLLIAFWALMSRLGHRGGKDVQERMSMQGLVAHRFVADETCSVDELFKESERNAEEHRLVATRSSSGRWELKSRHEL